MTTKVAIVNDYKGGGRTGLSYIKTVIENLPNNWSATVFQSDHTSLTLEESQILLNREVRLFNGTETGELDYFDMVISNDAWIGRFLDKIPRTIYISHGSAPMPCPTDAYYAEWTSFWDVIILASKSALKLTGYGISHYRKQRLSSNSSSPFEKKIEYDNLKASVSDLRKTVLCPVRPFKIIDKRNHRNLKNEDKLTIGILPTSTASIHPDLSLYNYLEQLIPTLVHEFPDADIIFRPYPNDLSDETLVHVIARINEFLGHYPNFYCDTSGKASTVFYKTCSIIVSDGSTGGLSFLLNRIIPPIYFKPIDTSKYSVPTDSFFKLLEDKILVSETKNELIENIKKCSKMSISDRIKIFERYCIDEFIEDRPLKFFLELLDIKKNNDLSDLSYVDPMGEFYYSSKYYLNEL